MTEQGRIAPYLRLNSEVVYLRNAYEGAFIKSLPEGVYWVKFKGKQPFKAVTKPKLSKLVTDAILEWDEITKEEYDNF
jgi:hypothetical protein